jgi:hypothetical protein
MNAGPALSDSAFLPNHRACQPFMTLVGEPPQFQGQPSQGALTLFRLGLRRLLYREL